MRTSLLVLCALLCASSLPAESTDAIVARMNEQAASFKGLSAHVNITTYTKVIDDKTDESGTLEMQRSSVKDLRVLLTLTSGSDSHIVFLAHNMARVLEGKTIKDYDLGKNATLVDQFLLLGFGGSGKDLMDNYDINNAGTQKISDEETTHLVLLPKNPQVKEKLQKAELWIPVGKAYPIQQQFIEPNGNYRLTTYSNVTLNPPRKKALEFKPPPGTTKE